MNRDTVGRYMIATILEKHGSCLKIHYDGWSSKWDCYVDYTTDTARFAEVGTISTRQAHRFTNLTKGDFIDINPTCRHPGWRAGEIRRFTPKSGQVQVIYEYQDKNFLYWVHLDNKQEVSQFGTMTKATPLMNSNNAIGTDDINTNGTNTNKQTPQNMTNSVPYLRKHRSKQTSPSQSVTVPAAPFSSNPAAPSAPSVPFAASDPSRSAAPSPSTPAANVDSNSMMHWNKKNREMTNNFNNSLTYRLFQNNYRSTSFCVTVVVGVLILLFIVLFVSAVVSLFTFDP